MRSAVLAAAFAFHPHLVWIRSPVSTLIRRAGPIALGWLDRRRERMNLE